ncbi:MULTISPECIES: hypothetical protein [unclassified Microcoleus]|uniref:hypothetical protein n=1 Tax=unclassified Microcoleus TaxID=2642155 RepID=UPI0025F4F1C7|nr:MULTISPECIES: hypothetical protein [unclassified Microcoleus]
MNSLILIFPSNGSGFQPIISGKIYILKTPGLLKNFVKASGDYNQENLGFFSMI